MCFALCIQGLIFVVDSNDRERVAESNEELNKMVGIKYIQYHNGQYTEL